MVSQEQDFKMVSFFFYYFLFWETTFLGAYLCYLYTKKQSVGVGWSGGQLEDDEVAIGDWVEEEGTVPGSFPPGPGRGEAL